jgi:hypothetical protein
MTYEDWEQQYVATAAAAAARHTEDGGALSGAPGLEAVVEAFRRDGGAMDEARELFEGIKAKEAAEAQVRGGGWLGWLVSSDGVGLVDEMVCVV